MNFLILSQIIFKCILFTSPITKKILKKDPVTMELIHDASAQRVNIVTTVGHDLLEDIGEKNR